MNFSNNDTEYIFVKITVKMCSESSLNWFNNYISFGYIKVQLGIIKLSVKAKFFYIKENIDLKFDRN